MSSVLFFLILLLLWQGAFWLLVDVLALCKAYALPSPVGVLERLITLTGNGTLLRAVGNSLLRGVIGYLAALILGLLLAHSEYLQKHVKPLILGIQTLPSICWVPFAILWFGLTTEAILFVVIMGSAFGIAIAVESAVKNVQPIYKKAALTMGATKLQLYRRVILPAALPEMISGAKQGWSFAWRALMSGEVMTTSIGLGQTLITGRDLADINQVMLVMLVIIVVGVVIDRGIFGILEKRVRKSRGLAQ
ncbi:MAG: ABC transporter permease [Eubacteriales bacterium]|nr:ABC transporter permease [Eubacteriales bacterium]